MKMLITESELQKENERCKELQKRCEYYARPYYFTLIGDWCKNEDKNDKCEFHSYPQDGECSCGIFKHHVHCHHGYIIQVG